MSGNNKLDCIIKSPTNTPTHAIIWLHGLGASANDFVPVIPHIDLNENIQLKYVFPNAPLRAVTVNNGIEMPAWYDILSLEVGPKREDEQGIRESIQQINTLIDEQIEQGIKAENIFLAGFSQGCAITLATGLRYSKKLAGLIALSGYLPLPQLAESEKSPSNQDTPILMVHGSHDPVVNVQRGEQSRDLLQSLGYSVDWHTFPMQHEVCIEEIHLIRDFINKNATA